MIVEKLKGIEERIGDTISKRMTDNYKSIDAKMNEVSETYADNMKRNLKPVAPPVNFRQILLESKNEDLIQQKEREVRSSNIIIHGLPESTTDTQEEGNNDDTTIKELLGNIELLFRTRISHSPWKTL